MKTNATKTKRKSAIGIVLALGLSSATAHAGGTTRSQQTKLMVGGALLTIVGLVAVTTWGPVTRLFATDDSDVRLKTHLSFFGMASVSLGTGIPMLAIGIAERQEDNRLRTTNVAVRF